MAEPVLMPQVGQDIKTARIVEWFKKENEEITKGEVIATVESDKAAFDVEAYTSGVLLKVLYTEGQDVEVLTPIAYIGQPGEQIGPSAPRRQAAGSVEPAGTPLRPEAADETPLAAHAPLTKHGRNSRIRFPAAVDRRSRARPRPASAVCGAGAGVSGAGSPLRCLCGSPP